jgi:hypothetical protein
MEWIIHIGPICGLVSGWISALQDLNETLLSGPVRNIVRGGQGNGKEGGGEEWEIRRPRGIGGRKLAGRTTV